MIYVLFALSFKTFRDERVREERKLNDELKEEWESRLEAIQRAYEVELQRRRADNDEQRELSVRLKREQDALERNMTLKRERKRADAKRALIALEQEATAHLVTKHSEEMLKLTKAKEAEQLPTPHWHQRTAPRVSGRVWGTPASSRSAARPWRLVASRLMTSRK